ncbi:PREDICTED: alpha-2-macroglobulin-P-like [Nanorana parkeri]|uniref:alpha-2-macroglobulin-P-like n=1 Tax=Nanorana parkeri TaxID=125878 RepID=UPI0008549D72|nr:PREDICTED: alpha-2-macroglobulin-P-like [Nanorana parkeri]
MQLLLVSVCLVICSSALVSATDPHYVITVPAEITQGFQEKACVVFQDLEGEVHLKLELQKDDQVQVIAEQDITSHDFFHCYPIQEVKVNLPLGREIYSYLKRFELLMNLPSNVVFTEKSFNLEVCGSYTYGKPVQGTLYVEVCYNSIAFDYYAYSYGTEESEYKEDNSITCIKTRDTKTDSKGCLSKEINLQYFNITRDMTELQISASLTEDGTGHTEKSKATLNLLKSQHIKFVDTDSVYHSGHPFTGKIVEGDSKKPMANVAVVISLLDHDDEIQTVKTVETNRDGLADFRLNTDSWKGILAIKVTGDDSDEDMESFLRSDHVKWLHPYYSESNSLLKVETITDTLPCDSDLSVKVDYHINKDQLDSKTDHISFFYIIRSGIGLHTHKEYKLDVAEQPSGCTLHGSFPIKIHIDADVFPHFSVLVYTILPKGETLSDRNRFNVSPCYKNKVQLKFSEEEVLPGGKVNLEVSAEAGSLCSVRSMDKGYFLQYPYEDYSFANDVINSVPRSLHEYTYGYFYEIDEPTQCPENQTKGNLYIITNTHIKLPVKCVAEVISARSSTTKKKSDSKAKTEKGKRTTRRFFPDTWLFDLALVGPEGHTLLNLTTPDSITKWETEAMCLGKSGIGEIRNVGLVTFQPYFIELILPYSVVQGEKFQIEAQVFSYEKQCILVVVSLSEADGIQTVQSKEQAQCVCDGHATYFSWNATASKLDKIKIHVDSGSLKVEGECIENALLITEEHRVDSVEKTILVKARGYKEQTAQTHILCHSDTTEKVTFIVKTPRRLVPGSEYAHIVVVGDLMGNPIKNLEDILALPDGCAEQSISKLSRCVTALEYLQSINKLASETKEKLLEGLVEGYQKQLTFKNQNGSYGFFTASTPTTWVTSLVVKGFSSALQFIYIDEKHILDSIQWLESNQMPNGCFNDTDSFLFYNEGEERKITQAAYILISLLEHPIAHNRNIVENAKSCISKGAETVNTPFNLAVMAYAFPLSGDTELRALMLKRLEEHAQKDDSGMKHWKGVGYRHGDIETSAYVILALLSDKIITHKELDECADVVRWLASKQNLMGGYFSSQDTTIALQALAKYAKATSHGNGESTVTIDGQSGFYKEIHIDKRNNLLLQMVDLPKVPGIYTASIKGNGCVYIQSHLHYHLLPDDHNNQFSVNVTTQPAVCSHEAQTTFEVLVDVRYLGEQPEIQMVVIKVELLSGHSTYKTSFKQDLKLEVHDSKEIQQT